ncbi:MAG: hypothetical protein NC254_13645 [bacterium]|nr:hypothetical protein [bacterium]
MRKIKKLVIGIVLVACVFGGNVGLCYAAQSSLAVEITATRAYGKFEYGEGGHRITVTVFYVEKDVSGNKREGYVSDNQFGNVTVAVVSKSSPDGYQYVNGYAVGLVDGNVQAISARDYA